MNPMRWMGTAGAGIAMVLLGCQGNISPQPEPPIRSDIGIDFGETEAKVDTFSRAAGLRGGPGSAQPAGGTLRVVNLENTTDPIDTIIAEDGSFDVALSVSLGDVLRVQIHDGGQRSDPFDVRVESDEAPPTMVLPIYPCVRLTPELELQVETGSAWVRVDNECEEAMILASPTLRRPIAGLTVGSSLSWPFSLPVGESLTVPVTVDGSVETPLEEVIFIWIDSAEQDRRPITVRSGLD